MIKGMKKEFMSSYLTLLLIFIYIQGLIVFSLAIERNYIDIALENKVDFHISFDQERTAIEKFQQIPELASNYSDSLTSKGYSHSSGLVGSSSYISMPRYFHYFFEDSLLLSFFNTSLNENEILITNSVAAQYNLSVGSSFIFNNYSYNVQEILPLGPQILISEVLYQVQHGETTSSSSLLFEFIIFPFSAFNITDRDHIDFFYYFIRYDRSLFSGLQYNALLSTTSSLNSIAESHLFIFEQSHITLSYHSLLYDRISLIRSDIVNFNLLFFLLTFSVLLSLFYFTSTFNVQLKEALHRVCVKLWMRGFSRRQTFGKLFFLFFFLSVFLLLLAILFNLFYILILGANISIFLLSSIILCLSFLFFFLLQLRFLFSLTSPKEEAFSLISTSTQELKEFISSLSSSFQIVSMKKKVFLVILCVVSLFSGLASLSPIISIHLSPLLKLNIFSYLADAFTQYFFSRDIHDPSYEYFRAGFVDYTLSIIFSIFIFSSLLFWILYFPLISSKFRSLSFKHIKDPYHSSILLKVFKSSIYKKKHIGKLLRLLFLFPLFTLPIVNFFITESQQSHLPLNNGDIVINCSHTTFNSKALEQLLVTSAVRTYLPLYQGEGTVISDTNYFRELYFFDPSLVLEYAKETTSYAFLKHSFSTVLTAMANNPANVILDSENFYRYHHYIYQDITIRGHMSGYIFNITATIFDTTNTNIIEPGSKNYMPRQQCNFISTSALDFQLNISSSKFIFISLNEGHDTEEFVGKLIKFANINSWAITFKSSQNSSSYVIPLIYWTILSTLAVLSLILSFQLYRGDSLLLAKLKIRGYSIKNLLISRVFFNLLYWLSSAGMIIGLTLIFFTIYNNVLNFVNYSEFLFPYLFFPPLTALILPIIIVFNLFLPPLFFLLNTSNPKKFDKLITVILNRQDHLF